MAVPEQIPVVNYVADGVVKKFDVQFEYDQQSDLHLYVDGVEPTIDKYFFADNAFNFYIAPTVGQNVKIKRITPKERDTDYDLHTNTVRPNALNADFDRIWYVLQEVFSDTGGLSQQLQDEIIARIQGDEIVSEDLKNYIDNMIALIIGDPSFNGVNADKVNDASGETQQQVNYNGGSKWHSRVDGYQENERVVLANGDIVKSTIDGNATDPNDDMTGWAPDFDTSAIQAEISTINTELSLKADTTYVDNQLTLKADTTYVDAAVGAISTDASKQYATLALANADIANINLNQNVFVSEDVNGGYWYKATAEATTLTKSPFDPVLQSKNYTDQSFVTAKNYTDQSLLTVKNDYLNIDQISDFRQSLTTGVFGSDFSTLSTATLSFVSGQVVISQTTSTDIIRSIFTGRQIIDTSNRILSLKFKTEDVSTTNGAAIFIGENLGVVYYSNGGLAVVDKNWQSQKSLATSFTDANLSYVANESVELEIQLNGDGSGVAVAKKSNGYYRNLAFTGLQKGKVYLATRRLLANKSFTFESFSVVEKPVTTQEVTQAMLKASLPVFNYTTDGFFSATNDAKSSLYKFSLTNNKIIVDTTAATTSNAVFYAKTGASFNSAAEFEIGSKILTGTVTAGMALVVGDGVNRKIFAYLNNGLIGTLKTDGNLDLGSVNAAMAYANNQVAKMRVSVSADGDAVLTAIHPDGRTAAFKTVGVVAGNVYPAWRGKDTTAEIQYLSKVDISPSSVAMVAKVEQLSQQSKFPKTWYVLPDSTPDRVVKGFTCTGLAKITAGNFRECFAVADDGRLAEDISSPFNPAVHLLDGQFRRILHTIPMPYSGASVQGVTYDTLSNYHIWVACSGNGTVRKFSVQMDTLGQEVDADRITVADLGLSITPNAAVFDSTRGTGKGALWLGDSITNTVYLIDCDPLSATRIIKTITLANNPDQFQLIDNILLYQSGGNGSRASIYAYDLTTDTESVKWSQLENLFAAEGFYYDRTWRTLYAVNDGGFHNTYASGPRFNCVFEYVLDY